MLDGEEILQIACGELRWEGARQHAGRIGNRANSLRRASLGGSDRASWTETKPWKSLAESFAGRERDSILDGLETVALGGSDTACWTERKPWK